MSTARPRLCAVITGDLVKSSDTAPTERRRVLASLRSVFDSVNRDVGHLEGFQIFRGDSFQTVLDKPLDALKAALLLRCRCLLKVGLDVRMAMGLGTIDYHSRRSVGEGIGPAFTASGHALDRMAEPRRLSIVTPDDAINAELVAFAAMLDAMVRSWTTRSTAVIAETVNGKTQKEVARALHLTQPAVSQRLATARWWAVQEAMERWEALVSQLSENLIRGKYKV